MSSLNATTQALLKANRNFLMSMTSIQAADQGLQLCRHILETEEKASGRLVSSGLFKADVIDGMRQWGQSYRRAVLFSFYKRLPEAQQLLEAKPRMKVVRRLRNK